MPSSLQRLTNSTPCAVSPAPMSGPDGVAKRHAVPEGRRAAPDGTERAQSLGVQRLEGVQLGIDRLGPFEMQDRRERAARETAAEVLDRRAHRQTRRAPRDGARSRDLGGGDVQRLLARHRRGQRHVVGGRAHLVAVGRVVPPGRAPRRRRSHRRSRRAAPCRDRGARRRRRRRTPRRRRRPPATAASGRRCGPSRTSGSASLIERRGSGA